MANTPRLPNEQFQFELRQRHLEQLRNVQPGLQGPRADPPANYDILVQWSTLAKAQIAAVISQRKSPIRLSRMQLKA